MKIGDERLDMLQEAWDRRHQVFRVWQAGMKKKAIAERLGISYSRVQQMVERARMELGSRSPLEIEFAKGAWGLVERLTDTCNNKAALKMLAAGRDVIVV